MPNISRTGNAAFSPYQSAASESIRNSPWSWNDSRGVTHLFFSSHQPIRCNLDSMETNRMVPTGHSGKTKENSSFSCPLVSISLNFSFVRDPTNNFISFLIFFKMKIRRKRREKRRKTKRKKKVHVLASPLLARSETHRHFSLSSSFFSFYHNKFRWVALHFFDYPCYDYFIGKPNGVFGLLFQGILKKYIYIYISFFFFFKLLSSISSFCSG